MVATFCPPFVCGPAAVKANSARDFRSSLGIFYALTRGPAIFPLDGHWMDARDIAQAYRMVVEIPLTTSERFLLAAGTHTTTELFGFAQTGDAALLQETPPINIDSAKAGQLLKWKPRSKKESFVDMLEFIKRQEKSSVE